jgi:flagellar hook-basal body complex protein FliE
MAPPIAPISTIRPIEPIALPVMPGQAATAPSGFHQVLAGAISQVSQSQDDAGKAVSDYLAGGTQELHSTILATQNASLNFELLLQVRNKVAAAYDEIMKMQI